MEPARASAMRLEIRSPDADEQTGRHTYRLLMSTSEAVIIGWLQVPPKEVPSRWPEQEVSGHLSREGICRFPVSFEKNPLRPHARHEFCLPGQVQRDFSSTSQLGQNQDGYCTKCCKKITLVNCPTNN
jgi:hypothetical protein